eukprot:g849.t1
MPRRGRKRRKRRTHKGAKLGEEKDYGRQSSTLDGSLLPSKKAQGTENLPKTFVFKHPVASCGPTLTKLVSDLRNVMMPLTADRLKESRKASLKDYIQVSGPLGITHFLCVSRTTSATNLRIIRLPQGPTLTFKIENFTLAKSVVQKQRRHVNQQNLKNHAPLVVLNNFINPTSNTTTDSSTTTPPSKTSTNHNPIALKLISATLKNLFPKLNVATVNLNECKRVLLADYDAKDETIALRHYAITARAVGVKGASRGVKKIVEKRIDYDSESEGEEDEASQVILADTLRGKGSNVVGGKSSIKLRELGPRLTLKLLKIESGISTGDVLFHRYHEKTAEEARELSKRKKQEREEKKRRREIQEENVKRKEDLKQRKKEAKRERKRKREEEAAEGEGKDTNTDQ